jgi:hypothetical protein
MGSEIESLKSLQIIPEIGKSIMQKLFSIRICIDHHQEKGSPLEDCDFNSFTKLKNREYNTHMIKEYIVYLKDNPPACAGREHLWFKRKLYGWGWMPATWEGWLVIAVYLVCVIVPTKALVMLARTNGDDMPPPFKLIPIVVFTAILITICCKKGEKPRWQWGKK